MSSGHILVGAVGAASSGSATGQLPANILRFELEYELAPELGAEIARLAHILESDNFELFPVHKDIGNILILQFPDVKRTVSRRGQFAMAAELAQRLGLRSCVPEGASGFQVDLPRDREDAEGAVGDAILNRTCWTTPNRSLAPDWVADSLNVREAWKKTKGAGVRIAQPDTGVAAHSEIDKALDLGRAFDVFTGRRGEATDPLDPAMGNPGHGTATSSVIASPHRALVSGIA